MNARAHPDKGPFFGLSVRSERARVNEWSDVSSGFIGWNRSESQQTDVFGAAGAG
jgi:hypothetical protein